MSALPANFWEGLSDPDVQYAEQLVYDYFRGEGIPCIDRRSQKLPWDFEVYPQPGILWRLDVKADHWMDESGRLPYETHHEYPDGSRKDGWGVIEELDKVAVVAVGKDGVPGSYRCVFVDRKAMHQLVEGEKARAEAQGRSMPFGWRTFARENEGGKVTHGWAVPMGEAFAAMVYRTVVQLPGGRG